MQSSPRRCAAVHLKSIYRYIVSPAGKKNPIREHGFCLSGVNLKFAVVPSIFSLLALRKTKHVKTLKRITVNSTDVVEETETQITPQL